MLMAFDRNGVAHPAKKVTLTAQETIEIQAELAILQRQIDKERQRILDAHETFKNQATFDRLCDKIFYRENVLEDGARWK